MRLILASASARRQALIPLLQIPWEIETADIDETTNPTLSPTEQVAEIAMRKATTVAARQTEAALIIAADTMVMFNGQLLGKAGSRNEAETLLRAMRGKTNEVYTALVVLDTKTDKQWSDTAVSQVQMRHYPESELQRYLDSGRYADKAGSYAIQDPAFTPAASYTGCYANIIGFPLCHLARALDHLGHRFPANLAASCEERHQIICPVYTDILPR